MMDSIALKMRIENFVLRSALVIDDGLLDEWLDCFEDSSRYIVIPRENRIRGLPGGLMHCENKARLADRITSLRHANKVNPHFDRHIMGGALITSVDNDVVAAQSNFLVVQTDLSGSSKLLRRQDCAACRNGKTHRAMRRCRYVLGADDAGDAALTLRIGCVGPETEHGSAAAN
jgi:3-phenylpropionate/cinnamic acid dioxygenase small subunit